MLSKNYNRIFIDKLNTYSDRYLNMKVTAETDNYDKDRFMINNANNDTDKNNEIMDSSFEAFV